MFGKNNIITRNFSSNKINNSKLLYELNNLLEGTHIISALILLSISISLFQFFFEQPGYFIEQFKYTWEHNFFESTENYI